MTPETILDTFSQGITIIILLITVIVTPGLIIGLVVAMFQAATQINEMSLSFVPKLFITFLSLSFFSPWILNLLIEYTEDLFEQIPLLIG